MSKRPSDRPVDGPLRPVPPVGGRPRLESLSRFDRVSDPGGGLLLYEAVVAQDTTRLSGDGWLDRLEAIARLKARMAALEAKTVAGFDDGLQGVSADLGHRHPEPGDRDAVAGERRWIAGDLRSVADEIALILQLRRGHATTRIHTSCELVHNFPATLHALTEGWLTERAAFTIATELSVLDDLEAVHAAEAAILEWAKTHPLVDLKRECRREVARRSPAATDKANQRAHDERSVRMHTDDFGRADLVHNQDAVDAAAVMTSLSRAAVHRRRHGDGRTMDQLRADIALERLLPRTKRPRGATAASEARDGGTDCEQTEESGYEPAGAEASVVIHATGAEVLALVSGEEEAGGEVDLSGPIPQRSLRKHLTNALIRALLPNFPLLRDGGWLGTTIGRARPAAGSNSRIELRVTDRPPPSDPNRYVPSAALDRYVRLRDRACQFPGCNRPAEFTDLDHWVAFAVGGRTTAANLWCLCRHHHRLKHEGGWRIHLNADGARIWVSPTGRRYLGSPLSTGREVRSGIVSKPGIFSDDSATCETTKDG